MNTLTDTQANILTEYKASLTLKGTRVPERASTITRYFRYLNSRSINFLYITTHDAQEYQDHLSLLTRDDGSSYYARASILAVIGRLTAFYDYLKMKKYIPINHFRQITRLRSEKSLPRDILAAEELAGVLDALKDFSRGKDIEERRRLYKAHVIAEVMYSTGARINEIARLTPEDVDLFRGVITLRETKTGTQRIGILSSFAEKALQLYVQKMRPYILNRKSDRRLLFGSSNYLYKWLNHMMSAQCAAQGLPRFRSHDFRHCTASHLLKNGCDVRFIQEILGHASIVTTQIYTKVVKEDLKNVLDRYHPRVLRHSSAQVFQRKDEAL